MKTLDEVIEAERHCIGKGCQGCPYDIVTYGGSCDCSDDAFHYLKEYKDKEAMYDSAFKIMEQARKQYHESVRQYVSAHANLYAEEPNDPLTWDELKQMEGKPVWVEYINSTAKAWALVLPAPYYIAKQNLISVKYSFTRSRILLSKKDCGIRWQAYRKERE